LIPARADAALDTLRLQTGASSTMHDNADFLGGVIEGFYGPPWSQAERLTLFDWMRAWGLNTYLYAPKDDLKQRALWREPYHAAEAAALGELVRASRQRNLRFIYALSPGLDIRFSEAGELDRLKARCEQMLALGAEHFALLFDDIPDRMREADHERFGSFAAAQCAVTNAVFRWVRDQRPAARFLFCPTPYCGWMAKRQLGGTGYLETVGRELLPGIDVFWTGPDIISREIPVAHIADVTGTLRRPPLIWDNLHANDYDGRRFYVGPYAGRPPELRGQVRGILSNPNTEFPLNFVPLRTLADFVQSQNEWTPRHAYESAMADWLPQFETASGVPALSDLLLLGDCYYLPHAEGPLAEALHAGAAELLRSSPAAWGGKAAAFVEPATRLRTLCARLAELRDRPLFYALNRRVWDLREELDLLLGYVSGRAANPDAPARSDYHRPGTFRGGLVARLQQLLPQNPDGTFTPSSTGHNTVSDP
jgi:protein O-GlcNAcase/histone acetyltransferase